jgi:hypothetical protein
LFVVLFNFFEFGHISSAPRWPALPIVDIPRQVEGKVNVEFIVLSDVPPFSIQVIFGCFLKAKRVHNC